MTDDLNNGCRGLKELPSHARDSSLTPPHPSCFWLAMSLSFSYSLFATTPNRKLNLKQAPKMICGKYPRVWIGINTNSVGESKIGGIAGRKGKK